MEWLFGRKKTPEEMLRENQRSLKKAMRFLSYCFESLNYRELERERSSLEKQETKVIIDLKKAAKAGQIVNAHRVLFHNSRMLQRLWRKISFELEDTSKR
jgi:hypothetical protein